MFRILTIVAASSFFAVAGKTYAEANEPFQPAAESPFTEASDPSLAGISSVAVPPIDISGMNLSFDVTIENPNNKPIRCLNTKMLAWMSPVDDRCQHQEYNAVIDLSEGRGYILIPANSTSPVMHAGNKERQARSLRLGKDLEFCRRDSWALNCGYDCKDGKVFDQEWDQTIDGGSRRYKCSRSGEAKRTPDPVSCQAGYAPDIANDRCLKKCDDVHIAGDPWTKNIDNGKIYYSCSSSGQITMSVVCDQSPKSYTAQGESCVPSPCPGGVAHGVRGNSALISHGTSDYRCEYGGWVDQQIHCDADSVKENNSCRLGNFCGSHKHQSTWNVLGRCSAECTLTKTTFKCEDGRESEVSSREIACSPPRGTVCN